MQLLTYTIRRQRDSWARIVDVVKCKDTEGFPYLLS